ncbi:MAG TPA: NHL repeat-containing protein [Solirubrobacteraceae bacterium]|nr:NHL repeat-containing protein [Solirubrobacteraceae bacterium]
MAIAIAPDGSSYVVDAHRRKVVHYSYDGAYISSWGDTGEVPTPLALPIGVAVDEAGNVWIADEWASALVRFTASGTRLASVGIDEPLGVSYDGAATIESSSAAGIIAFYSLAGASEGYFAPGGSEDFEIASPQAIFAEPSGGTVAIVGNEVERFDASHTKIAHWRIDRPEDSAPAYPTGVAESGGTVLVTDGDNDLIKLYTSNGSFLESWGYAGRPPRLGALENPQGLAVDSSDGSTLVADADNHRVQRFDARGLAEAEFGAPGEGELIAPGGIAEASDGSFWVADTGADRVDHFAPSGNLLESVGPTGNGFTRLSEPTDIAIGGDGTMYVTDRGNNRVVELSASGSFIRAFDGNGSATGRLKDPAGVAIDGTSLFVVDEGHDRVVRFGLEGASEGAWGQEGSGPGRFRSPEGVNATVGGDLLVADTGNYRIQRLTPEGAVVQIYPAPQSYESIADPTELEDGSIAAITGFTTITDYSPAGAVAWSFDAAGGTNSGEDRGVAVADGHLLVTDAHGDRIQRFALKPVGERSGAPQGEEQPTSEKPAGEGGTTPPGGGTGASSAAASASASSSASSGALVQLVEWPSSTGAGNWQRSTASQLGGKQRGTSCDRGRFSYLFKELDRKALAVRRLEVCGRPGGTILVECRPASRGCPGRRILSLGSVATVDLVARLNLTRLPAGATLLIGYANGSVRTGVRFGVRVIHGALVPSREQLRCWPSGKPEPGSC